MVGKDDNQERIDSWHDASEGPVPTGCEVLILARPCLGRNKQYSDAVRCLKAIDSNKDRLGGTVSQINISDPEAVMKSRLDGAVEGVASIGKGSIHVRAGVFTVGDIERLADKYSDTALVVVDKISKLGSGASEIRDAIDALVTEGRAISVLDAGLNVNRGNRETAVKLLDALDDSGADLKRSSARREFLDSVTEEERRHDGRPPAFFNVEDGLLVPSEDYDDAVATLRSVKYEDMPKRAAARHLDVSRRTVNRCLDRPELYDLD